MSRAKEASKQKKSRTCAVPLLGAAGLSLSLASGASALPGGPVVDMPTQNTGLSHDITLTVEEEISDVTLATFYVLTIFRTQWNSGMTPILMSRS